MEFIVVTVVAGMLATAGMSFFLWWVTMSGITNADMIRALGGFATKKFDNSVVPGTMMHFAAGIPFAMLYTYIFQQLPLSSSGQLVFIGGMMGLLHGFAFSFVLIYAAEHHPVKEFQKAEISVAVAHTAAHLVFGVLIGLVIGWSPLGPKPSSASEAFHNGELAVQIEAYDHAVGYLKKAVMLDPENAEAYNLLGLSYQKLADQDSAVKFYNMAIAADAQNRDAHRNLGLIMLRQKNVEKAQQHLDELKRICYFTIFVQCPQFTQLQQAMDISKGMK